MLKYFQIGHVEVPAYGLVALLAIVLCSFISVELARKYDLDLQKLVIVEFCFGICAVFGAKLITVIWGWQSGTYLHFVTSFRKAGYSYYGGLAGILIASFVLVIIFRFNLDEYEQRLTFLIPLTHAVWKLGCFLGGCCFGIPYSGPGAVIFPQGINAVSGQKVFPVQILEALISFLMAGLFLLLGRKGKRHLFSIYLIIYSFTRFFVEFLRFHESVTFISDGQLNSLIFMIIGYVLLRFMREVGETYE